jgi:hypothetical protein
MEAEITNLRAQLSRIEQEQKARTEPWLRLEKVSRGMAVPFGLTAIVLIIAGAIFLGRSNPIFPFALSLIPDEHSARLARADATQPFVVT